MKYYLTGKQAQAVDKYTQEKLGVPGLTLMESAAGKLAEAIDDVIKHASEYAEKAENLWCSAGYKKLSGIVQGKTENEIKILSVVESGNNGGDAVAAAWMLKDMGYEDVRLIDTADGTWITKREAIWMELYGSALLVGRK